MRLITDRVPQLALSVTAEGYNALHIAVAHRQSAIVKLLTQKQVIIIIIVCVINTPHNVGTMVSS